MTDKPGAFYATYLPSNHEIIKNSTKYEYQSQNVYHLQLKMYVYKINSNHILIFFYSQHYAEEMFFHGRTKGTDVVPRRVLKQTFRAFTFRNFRKLFVTH